MIHKFNAILIIAIGTFILSLVGLYNGYPLVYSDTGTYIYSGFSKYIPFDRPITYGLFIYIFSFKYSLWLVILVQNLLTAIIIYETIKTLNFQQKVLNRLFLLLLLFLEALTGIGYYSNQIMPDFFTPIAILLIYLLLVLKKQQAFKISILSIVLIYAIICHFSNLFIIIGIVIFTTLIKLFFKGKLDSISFPRILLVSTITLSAWIILPTINYIVEKDFTVSKGTHVFLMGHLVDAGILEKFLKENCQNSEYMDCKLCAYKDSLPGDLASFIWGSAAFKNSGGWKESQEEYDKIIHATLKKPTYLFMNIYRSINYGFIQLTKFKIGQGLGSYSEGSAPYGQISWRFHSELNNYKISRQNHYQGATFSLNRLNNLHTTLIFTSVFLLIIILFSPFYKGIESNFKLLMLIVLSGIFINAFITAGLNSPCDRFQARVVWLLPCALFLFFAKYYKEIINSIIDNINPYNLKNKNS